MTRLFVSVSDLEAVATKANTANTNLRLHIGAVDDLASSLDSTFEGDAARQYATSMDGWVTQATKLADSMDGLAKFLTAAAKAVGEVDEKLAKALGGGGAADQIAADSSFLDGLTTRLQNIADHLEDGEKAFDGGGCGSGDISGALDHFRDSWSDARKNMVKSLRAAHDMTAAASEVYADTDSQLAKALQS